MNITRTNEYYRKRHKQRQSLYIQQLWSAMYGEVGSNSTNRQDEGPLEQHMYHNTLPEPACNRPGVQQILANFKTAHSVPVIQTILHARLPRSQYTQQPWQLFIMKAQQFSYTNTPTLVAIATPTAAPYHNPPMRARCWSVCTLQSVCIKLLPVSSPMH